MLTRNELQYQTILRGQNHTYYHHSLSPPALSIKTMANGHALYTIEGAKFAVDESHYLILNTHQNYTIEISSPTVVQSYCIFFPYGWVEDVARGAVLSDQSLLDRALTGTEGEVRFFEQLHPHDSTVSAWMWRMRDVLNGDGVTVGWLEEQLRGLLLAMLHVQQGIYQQVEQIPAVRASTREELYRRLHLARDYMHASLDSPISLAEIAAHALLSPYHFLRAFKRVFGQTPHAYLTQKRLERACFLLSRTTIPVTEICFSVGFESLGSFSTLFRKQIGLTPRAYRQTERV